MSLLRGLECPQIDLKGETYDCSIVREPKCSNSFKVLYARMKLEVFLLFHCFIAVRKSDDYVEQLIKDKLRFLDVEFPPIDRD